MNQPIFSSRSSPYKKTLLMVVAICGLLLLVDVAFPQVFNVVQNAVKFAFDPLYVTSDLTSKASSAVASRARSKSDLLEELSTLQKENLQDQVRLQKLAQLQFENTQYRQMLALPATHTESLFFAEVIGHAVDLDSNVLILNKGSKHHVHLGQFVVDSQGLMGKITEVYPFTSRLMLISDKHLSVSVRVQRTGMLAVLSGTGDATHLTVDYVPATADIKAGDILLTSGVGGQFNAGYPVGVVESVSKRGKSEFSDISVKPVSSLQGSTLVVLLSYTAPPVVVAPKPLPPPVQAVVKARGDVSAAPAVSNSGGSSAAPLLEKPIDTPAEADNGGE